MIGIHVLLIYLLNEIHSKRTDSFTSISNKTVISEFPFIVSILIRKEGRSTRETQWKLKCAGVIITTAAVLTSGLCIHRIMTRNVGRDMLVRGNTESWNCSCGRTRDHTISGYLVHRKFKQNKEYSLPSIFENDIAIITVTEKFTGIYEEICSYLVGNSFWNRNRLNAKVAVVGWGHHDSKYLPFKQLSVVHVKIYPKSKCESFYRRQLPSYTYCAGLESLGHGLCDYVQGAPMLTAARDSEDISGELYSIIGLSSTVKSCTDKPAIYTNISMFSGWIQTSLVKDTLSIDDWFN